MMSGFANDVIICMIHGLINTMTDGMINGMIESRACSAALRAGDVEGCMVLRVVGC